MDGSGSGTGYPHTSGAGPSNVPRRLSYATVASGAGQTSQPQRSGAFRHLTSVITPTASPFTHTEQRSDNPADVSMYGTKESVTRATPLPEYSRKYANTRAGPGFFVPSYLRESRYMAKLEAARSRSTRERSSSTPSFTANTNVQRLAPSHRGMTYDIIESNPPKEEEDELVPLPSRWNNQDKYPGLEVTNDGFDVKYSGSAGKAETEAASIRADSSIDPSCGIYYFEIHIKQKSTNCAVAVGFSLGRASLERLPGWEAESWAYHSDDGRSFCGEHQGRNYGPTFAANDVIGCGMDFVKGQIFFSRNGHDLGPAFRDLKNIRPFPSVGIKKYSGAIITVNFGQSPFLFDIDQKVNRERYNVRQEIKRTQTTGLHPGLSEQSLVQELVAQFLSHGGYVETAAAFAEQRKRERKALDEVSSSSEENAEADSTSAVHRQQIRGAILSGDISLALQVTDRYFPNILRESPEIVFRLKCRKWVELISQASDLRMRQAGPTQRRGSNGFSPNTRLKPVAADGFDPRMEVDEEQHSGTNNTSNLVSTGDSDLAYDQLMTEAINYGQELQREYRDKSNLEYRRTLEDIFSLVAYNDPRDSVHGSLLDSDGRLKVAEELNSAILVSLGKPPSAALEKVYRQTEALLAVVSHDAGPACFVNLENQFNTMKG